MSTCTANRPTYGLPELIALVVTLLRPWLDAVKAEFARPVPAPQPQPAPPVEPAPVPAPVTEPAADVPVVVEVTPAVAPVTVEPVPAVVEQVAEVPADEPLFVKKGDGRGSRYVPAAPTDDGPKYRRRMVGTSRTVYEPAA